MPLNDASDFNPRRLNNLFHVARIPDVHTPLVSYCGISLSDEPYSNSEKYITEGAIQEIPPSNICQDCIRKFNASKAHRKEEV